METPTNKNQTPNVLKDFEAKHGEGKVKLIVLSNADGENLAVHIQKPDRKALSDYMVWIDKDALKAYKLIISKCLLDKHDEVNADDEFFIATGLAIASLMPIGSFEIKND